MSTTVYEVLDELETHSTTNSDKGSKLEKLMVQFLRTDPVYSEQFSDVWLWGDWPGNRGKHDTGIDIVAVDMVTGLDVAIQCKFYDQKHQISKSDIDTFLSASGKAGFGERIIVSTTDKWNHHAEDAIRDQQIPVRRIGLADLEASVVDWDEFDWATPEILPVTEKKKIRPHQRTAIDKVRAGFATDDRGKLIMACGTGKTFTALRLAEEQVGAGGTVLFLAPSISLVGQTLREWASSSEVPLTSMAVCSDPKVSRSASSSEDISTVDLALPATTDPSILSTRLQNALADGETMSVVFATYQSIDVVAHAQADAGAPPFDLIICDEAHRTTGVTIAGSDESAFVRVHDDNYLHGRKRLYMTATPRIFGEDSKKKAAEGAAVLASMDDEVVYGRELHRLGFGEAVEKRLLTDYRVLILTVDEEYVTKNFQQELAQDGEIPLGDAARIIGCWNGLAKHFETASGESLTPMKRAVAFAQDIRTSKAIAAAFPDIVERHVSTLDLPEDATNRSTDLSVECEHVDGTFNALARAERIGWLKQDPGTDTCRILTNARCLSEGIDVPALDAVLFMSGRNSEVDVVQSVGRVMRRAEGKNYGYIILPIVVPAGMPPEEALADNKKYQVVWQVLRALRAHDDRFTAMVNKIDLNKSKKLPRIGIGGIDRDGNLLTNDHEAVQGTLDLQFGQWRDAILAKLVKNVGERRYWETWAKDVADIAQQHIARINGILATGDTAASAQFATFLEGLRGNLNDGVSQEDAVEMLAQHLITRPVFDALFGGYDFAANNPVAQAMEKMLAALDEHSLDTENQSLEKFYGSVRSRVEGIDNAEGRQKIMIELYDKFFATAFKRTVDKLGIVYTPVEIVDFILRSADELSRKHFGEGLTDEGVHILDGFAGTGTFITRLLQLGLIEPKDLLRKYRRELHANEILLLAYYIAAVNIETTFQDIRGDLLNEADYEPFPGLILTDTFQSWEHDDSLDTVVFQQNNQRLEELKKLNIRVLIGNPPYSSGQDSANDNNANESYPGLDAAIRDTYAARSGNVNRVSLYDSYIRAIKWASLRLKERGIIAYVTNGGWLDSNTADGMRLSLADEFSDIYVYNLRGYAISSGEKRKREAGNVFGGGSKATVAITVLVKDPSQPHPARVHYTDIGDYLSREEKLATVAEAGSVSALRAVAITPNKYGDWITQRSATTEDEMLIGGRKGTATKVFDLETFGLMTNRDAWTNNFSQTQLTTSIERMFTAYETERTRIQGISIANKGDLPALVNNNPRDISWSTVILNDLWKGRQLTFEPSYVRVGSYRPFCRQHVYWHRDAVHSAYKLTQVLPSTLGVRNQMIAVTAPGSHYDFTLLMCDELPNRHFLDTCTLFARWRYEPATPVEGTLDFGVDDGDVVDGYHRIDNITDEALAAFRAAYGPGFAKDDIFDYCYGLLHSPDYRETYAADLKKMLPRIPLVTDPWPYVQAGRELAKLHLGYEEVTPYPLVGLETEPSGAASWEFYQVEKMAFAKKRNPETKKLVADRSTIIYNKRITLSDIPEEAYRYMLGSRSAIEWIMDRYQFKKDKPSGIVNDPNDWSREVGDPRYILDLLARVVTVSLETMKIVDSLPPLQIAE